MEKLESLKRELVELDEFTPERFNDHYRNLIDIAVPSSREYELLHTLTFISSCQIVIDSVKKVLHDFFTEIGEKQPDENHGPLCAAKEEAIQALKEANESLMDSLKKQRERIKTYEKIIDNKEELIRILKGENGTPPDRYLKVCEK